MALSASNRNITFDQCIALFNNILTRDRTAQVINPASGRLIFPNGGTAEYLINRCRTNHPDNNHLQLLVTRVEEEVREEVAHSPFLQRTRPDLPHPPAAAPAPLVPPAAPAAPQIQISREQCALYLHRILTRTENNVINPLSGRSFDPNGARGYNLRIHCRNTYPEFNNIVNNQVWRELTGQIAFSPYMRTRFPARQTGEVPVIPGLNLAQVAPAAPAAPAGPQEDMSPYVRTLQFRRATFNGPVLPRSNAPEPPIEDIETLTPLQLLKKIIPKRPGDATNIEVTALKEFLYIDAKQIFTPGHNNESPFIILTNSINKFKRVIESNKNLLNANILQIYDDIVTLSIRYMDEPYNRLYYAHKILEHVVTKIYTATFNPDIDDDYTSVLFTHINNDDTTHRIRVIKSRMHHLLLAYLRDYLVILYEPFIRFIHYDSIYRYWKLFTQVFRLGSAFTYHNMDTSDTAEIERQPLLRGQWNIAPVPQYIPKEAWNHAIRTHSNAVPNLTHRIWEYKYIDVYTNNTLTQQYVLYIDTISRLSRRINTDQITIVEIRKSIWEMVRYPMIDIETLLQVRSIDGLRYLGSTALQMNYRFIINAACELMNLSDSTQALVERILLGGLSAPYIEKADSKSSTSKAIQAFRASSKSISVERAQQMPIPCGRKFDDIIVNGNPFKRFAIKLKKVCTKIYDQEPCRDRNILEKITKDLRGRYNIAPLLHNTRQIHNVNTDTKEHFKRLFNKFLTTYGYNEINAEFTKDLYRYFKLTPLQFNITFSGINQGDARGPGTTQVFLQTCANQLFEYHILRKDDSESKRYILNTLLVANPREENPNNKPFSLEGYQFPQWISDLEKRLRIIRFAGAFIGFLLINSIKLPEGLSRAILSQMIYSPDEISDEEYVSYYIEDYPVRSVGYINLMKTPQHIDELGMSLDDDEPELTIDNFVSELKRYVRKKYVNDFYKAFLEGFFVTRKFLVNRDVTINILDTLITGLEVSNDAINEIIADIDAHNAVRTDVHRQRFEWFKNILRDDGRKFPTEHARANPNVPQDVVSFKKQLLTYWTGISNYKNDREIGKPYKVYVVSGNQFATRTCHKIIELPYAANYLPGEPFTEENYYKRLLENVVQLGMGVI